MYSNNIYLLPFLILVAAQLTFTHWGLARPIPVLAYPEVITVELVALVAIVVCLCAIGIARVLHIAVVETELGTIADSYYKLKLKVFVLVVATESKHAK